jgi:hypothetical protein
MFQNQQKNNSGDERRIRRRFRGLMESKTGKVVGFTSLAAPVFGYIVNDLRKPNSIIRQLFCQAVNKLLESKNKQVEAIDITDQVEIIDTDKK